MSEQQAILNDLEIKHHHDAIGADFGSTTAIEVVQKGLLKAACGWHNGYTCETILKHHGLVEEHDGAISLTRKGKSYLWEVYKDVIPKTL